MFKRIFLKCLLLSSLLITVFACNEKIGHEHNIVVDSGAELGIATGSVTNSSLTTQDTRENSLKLEDPGGNNTDKDTIYTQGTVTGTGTVNPTGIELGSTQSTGVSNSTSHGSGEPNGGADPTGGSNSPPNGESTGGIDSISKGDYTQSIKSFNILIIAFFFLLISLYLLKISSESWLNYKWYRGEEFLKNKRAEYDSEIEQLIKMMGFGDKPELRPKNYVENLNEEIKRIQGEKNDIRSTEKLPKFSFEQVMKKNILIILIAIAFFGTYIAILGKFTYELDSTNYVDSIDLLFSKSSFFTFPILIIASYFSVISLFRFMLIQGSHNNSGNKFSFFGLIVSLITLTGAIITISKYILG